MQTTGTPTHSTYCTDTGIDIQMCEASTARIHVRHHKQIPTPPLTHAHAILCRRPKMSFRFKPTASYKQT
uniref:Uncharacterized protein n=1 Tax=Anguilla anguilla TaxID=7936 RepID=A0A0E9PCD8_ANGAN